MGRRGGHMAVHATAREIAQRQSKTDCRLPDLPGIRSEVAGMRGRQTENAQRRLRWMPVRDGFEDLHAERDVLAARARRYG